MRNAAPTRVSTIESSVSGRTSSRTLRTAVNASGADATAALIRAVTRAIW